MIGLLLLGAGIALAGVTNAIGIGLLVYVGGFLSGIGALFLFDGLTDDDDG